MGIVKKFYFGKLLFYRRETRVLKNSAFSSANYFTESIFEQNFKAKRRD